MKLTAVMVFVAMGLRVCGQSPRQPTVTEAPRTEQVPTGATTGVAVSAALTTNVSAQPDGTLIAEVRDPAGEPVRAHAITVEIRRPDEDPVPVVMTYDEPQHRYVGHIAGVSAGSYPVQVTVQATPTAQPVEIVSPAITVATPTVAVVAPTTVVEPTTTVVTPTTTVVAPRVEVERPAAAVVAPTVQVAVPSVVVTPVVPGVVVVGDDDHHDHGRHRGHWRGHGRGHGRGRGVFFGIFH
jgi:hypothetical protein